ncbi:unnamed protein product [Arctogadus glacialis]
MTSSGWLFPSLRRSTAVLGLMPGRCIDWSVDLKRLPGSVRRARPGQVCLFYSYIRTNYTMATNAKLRLIWYKNKGDSEAAERPEQLSCVEADKMSSEE